MFSKALITSLVATGALAAAAPAIACDDSTPTLTGPTPVHAGVSEPSLVSPDPISLDQPDSPSLLAPRVINNPVLPDRDPPTLGDDNQVDPPRMPPGATPPTPCGP